MIAIVDYGSGNLASISNMFRKIGVEVITTSDHAVIKNASKLVLPGVGAFDTCARKLAESGLADVLNKKVIQQKTPVLGICVGMQLMMERSEEGVLPGLGWVKGSTVKFDLQKIGERARIPHMGWAEVEVSKSSKLVSDIAVPSRFYFVHSYHVSPENEDDVLIYATHGYRFVAAIEHENICGVQFHPEKSHKFGMRLLENFSRE